MTQLFKPLVSVIIPFLNEERFLSEAIESVIHQTYPEWEMILVDDGSSDKSSDIAKAYACKNADKINYAEHEGHANKGLSASRNLGIYRAKGDFIAFLDADDVWLPEKLQLQVALMIANPQAAMLCEASEYWYYNWHDKSKKNVVKQVGKERDKLFMPPQLAQVLYPLSNSQAPTPSGIIVKRAIAIKHGGFEVNFTGKYQMYEDQPFLHKIYLNEAVYISSLCNHKYRQREDSLVRKTTSEGDYPIVRKYFLEWLEQYMDKHNFRQRNVHKLLKRALEPYRSPNLYRTRKFVTRIARAIERRITLKWLLHQ